MPSGESKIFMGLIGCSMYRIPVSNRVMQKLQINSCNCKTSWPEQDLTPFEPVIDGHGQSLTIRSPGLITSIPHLDTGQFPPNKNPLDLNNGLIS
jgi:hypothetical protein